jgi:ABC-type phosphate transport system substrate-binding protein
MEPRRQSVGVVLGLILSFPFLSGASASPPEYKVVVSTANPVTTLTRREAAAIFLKKKTRWEAGGEIAPVDQSATSLVRAAFTREVLDSEGLGRLSAVQTFWQQQLYSGRSTPPAIKVSDAEVVAFVAANREAIGYVSAETATSGVKTLTIQP